MTMASISGWWAGLEAGGQFFYGIALVATFVLLVQVALMLFGMHGGGDLEVDAGGGLDAGADVPLDAADFGDGSGALDHHHGDGLGILSFRTIVAFLVGFGWIGVMSIESGLRPVVALIPAGLAGLAVMLVVWWLMRVLLRLGSSGTLDFANAVGEVGTVYVPIPPNREGPGQVEVMIQGRLMVVEALSSAAERLEHHAKVLVVDVTDQNALIVRPVD